MGPWVDHLGTKAGALLSIWPILCAGMLSPRASHREHRLMRPHPSSEPTQRYCQSQQVPDTRGNSKSGKAFQSVGSPEAHSLRQLLCLLRAFWLFFFLFLNQFLQFKNHSFQFCLFPVSLKGENPSLSASVLKILGNILLALSQVTCLLLGIIKVARE